MEEIKVGDKYRHYKNNEHIYEIVGFARNSDTLEEMVIYKALYENKEFTYGTSWVRSKEMFIGNVVVDGKEIKRFEKIN